MAPYGRTVDGPAVAGTSRRVRIPELMSSQCLSPSMWISQPVLTCTIDNRPPDSKQQVFETVVVLWHDAVPVVLHPELIRLNRLWLSTGEPSNGEAAAAATRAPRASDQWTIAV